MNCVHIFVEILECRPPSLTTCPLPLPLPFIAASSASLWLEYVTFTPTSGPLHCCSLCQVSSQSLHYPDTNPSVTSSGRPSSGRPSLSICVQDPFPILHALFHLFFMLGSTQKYSVLFGFAFCLSSSFQNVKSLRTRILSYSPLWSPSTQNSPEVIECVRGCQP